MIKERNVLRMYILQDSTAENIEEYSKARSLTNKTPREKKRLSEKKKIDVIEAYKINPRLFFKKFKSVKEGFKGRTHIMKETY